MNVGDLFFGVHIDDSGFIPSVQKTATAAGDAGAKTFSSRFQRGFAGISQGFKQSISTGFGIGAGLGVFSLVDKALSSVVNYMGEAVTAASDLNETVNKSAVVFGPASAEIEAFGKTAATQLGLSENAAIGAAASIGNLLRSTGTAPAQIAPMSMAIVKLAADLASFNNIPIEDALAKLQSGLVGQERPLRELGVAISAASVDTQAAAMGFKKLNGVFSEGEKVQARYALIFKQTTTAQGDFARTADGLANSQRIANAELENLKAQVGQGLEQAFTALMPTIKGAIGLVGEFVSGVGEIGTAFNNLNRFLDPNVAATQNFEAALRKAGAAAHLTADEIDALVKKHEEEIKAASDNAAFVEQARYQNEVNKSILDGALATGEITQAMYDQELAAGAVTAAQLRAASGIDDTAKASDAATVALDRQAQAYVDQQLAIKANGKAQHDRLLGMSLDAEAYGATIAETGTKTLSAYNAMSNAAIDGSNAIRAANKNLEASYLSLGTDFKATLHQMAQDAKTGLANIRFTMTHDGTETKRILERDMKEAVKLRNKAFAEGNTRALAEADAYIADLKTKLANLNMKTTITTTSVLGHGHEQGQGGMGGYASGGFVPPGVGGWVGELGREWLQQLPGGGGFVVPHNQTAGFTMADRATAAPVIGAQGTGTMRHEGTVRLEMSAATLQAMHQAGYSGREVGEAARAASGIDGLIRNLRRESSLPVEG